MMRVRDSNYGKNSNSRMLNHFVQHYLLNGKIYLGAENCAANLR